MKYVRWVFLALFFGSAIALLIWGPRAVDKHYVIGAQFSEADDEGVKVERVLPGSPAERAGLLKGDLITKVDGHAVSDLTAFFAEVSPHPTGAKVNLNVKRGSDPEQTFPVTMEDAKDRVIVHYWEKWTGTEADQMKQIVSQFNTTVGTEKGIYVEYMSMTNVDRKTLVATASGVPPEVAGLWQDQVAQWGGLDALEPLEDMAKQYNIDDKYYKPVYWDALHYNGHLVGLISTPASIMLHWNKDLFKATAKRLHEEGRDDEMKKAGFTGERAPRTIKEVQEWSKLITEWDIKPDGRKSLKVAGFIPSEPGWWRTRTPIWWGAHLYDPKTDEFTFTTPECVQAFEFWASFSQPDNLGWAALNEFSSGFGNFASAQNSFLAGKVAMTFQGPWMVNFIQMYKPEWNNPAVAGLSPDSPEFKQKMKEFRKLSPEKRRELAGWGVAPFPSVYADEIVEKYKGDEKRIDEELVKHGVAFCDFDVLMIPKGLDEVHKKAAFEFIAYVNRQEVMETLCSLQGKPTPFQSPPRPEWLARHLNPYIDQFDMIARSEHSQAQPKVPVWPEAEEALGPAVDRITRLTQTPLEALKQAEERAQPNLKYFRKLEAARK
jgi:multiple sugar transport system substrate-binding protein